jgi:DNA mismatch endonuclease (patch repair protein)
MTIFGATKITLPRQPKQVIRLPQFAAPSPSRSANMRAITARGNRTTEARLRALLVRAGIRGWKLHALTFPGTPDFLFADEKIAVFTHGCFWHGCPRCGHLPRTNSAYWRAKIARNRRRDRNAGGALRRAGYVVITLWECQLRRSASKCVTQIASTLASRMSN